MLRDAFDYNGDPGIAVMLTGDGSGFDDGVGFHADLERMRRCGWRVEVLSWWHGCNRAMRSWAEQHGTFIALDEHYESVTFLEPPAPGRPLAEPRAACRSTSAEVESSQQDEVQSGRERMAIERQALDRGEVDLPT